MADDGSCESVGPPGALAFAADRDVWAGALEGVESEFADDGEVFGAVVLAVAGAVFVEDGIEDPVDAIFDAPVGADGGGKPLGSQVRRSEIEAVRAGDPAVTLDLGFDHGDTGKPRHHRLAGVAAIGDQPGDVAADRMTAHLNAAVVGVGGLAAVHAFRQRIAKKASTSLSIAGRLAFSANR